MKRRIIIIIISIFASLLIVPIVNIISTPNLSEIKWKRKHFLYNTDFVSKLAARVLHPLGISIAAKQVIVGHDGWLYLGDFYEEIVSTGRRNPASLDVERSEKIGAATIVWNDYLLSKGVKLFKIMIGPNKGSIYPENMPNWAKPVLPSVTDAFFTEVSNEIYIDLRGSLLEARKNNLANLYYKTDTHWNNLGASVAFRDFAKNVAAAAPDIQWPSDAAYQLSDVVPRGGGDLAGFLRMETHLSDFEAIMATSAIAVETTQINFDTKEIVYAGGNPLIGAQQQPLLVQSSEALNNKKVLWLRDSFGTAISPYMAATFSDVLQLHWGEALRPGGRIIQLVEEWKPDYVFVTVVERAARADFFLIPPPK